MSFICQQHLFITERCLTPELTRREELREASDFGNDIRAISARVEGVVMQRHRYLPPQCQNAEHPHALLVSYIAQ